MKSKTNLTGMIVAVLLNMDDMGSTAEEIAVALGLPIEGAQLQQELEELVAVGALERWGIGRGALYRPTVAPPRLQEGPNTERLRSA